MLKWEAKRLSEATTCYLGLGANLPFAGKSPDQSVIAAIDVLAKMVFDDVRRSPLYVTTSVPDTGQPDFVNCVLVGETQLSVSDLLTACQKVEAQFGRERQARWSARTLDIDILSYGDAVVPADGTWSALSADAADGAVMAPLAVPHLSLHERAFVLVPLVDVAPSWRHPVLNKTSVELLQALPKADRASVRPFSAENA